MDGLGCIDLLNLPSYDERCDEIYQDSTNQNAEDQAMYNIGERVPSTAPTR